MGTCKPSIICLDNGIQLCVGILDGTEDDEIVSTTFPLEIRRIEVFNNRGNLITWAYHSLKKIVLKLNNQKFWR